MDIIDELESIPCLLEKGHGGLVRARQLVCEIQRILELPFVPVKDIAILEGFEAANQVTGIAWKAANEIKRLRAGK